MDEFAENLGNVSTTSPSCVYKNSKLFSIQPQGAPSSLRSLFARVSKFRMNRHTRDFNSLRSDTVVDQLPPRVNARYQIQGNVVACPAFPKAITRISHHGDEWYSLGKFKFLQYSGENMLGQRMNADDDVRAPALKQLDHVTNRALVKELTRFRPDPIHAPVEIFHPMLPVGEYPIVQLDQALSQVV